MKRASKEQPPEALPRVRSLETWIWDAACSIRGARDAPNGTERHRLPAKAARRVCAAARINCKDYILPLIFTWRLCDVFDDTAWRDSAPFESNGKLQSVPEGQDQLDRIVDLAELKKNDYNISPAATSTPATPQPTGPSRRSSRN